jgi:hypothetical protein
MKNVSSILIHMCASQIPELSTSQLAGALPLAPTELFRLAAVILCVKIYFLI